MILASSHLNYGSFQHLENNQGAGGTYMVSTGVHIGSSQFLPVFFANFSLSLAPVFLMVIASCLRFATVYNPLRPAR